MQNFQSIVFVMIVVNSLVLIRNVNCDNKTIVCGRATSLLEDCFHDHHNLMSSDLNEYLHTTKIPLNEKEITAKCTVFKRGMSCFYNYTKKCLSEDKLVLYENSISGAKRFEYKLCDDRKFQSEFLMHKECLVHIKDDWDRCMQVFQNILTDEMHKTSPNPNHKFMQFCCSRYAYELCVFKSARYKCFTKSAEFVRDVVRLMSDEKHFSNCKSYEGLICAGTINTINLKFLLICSFLLLIISKLFNY